MIIQCMDTGLGSGAQDILSLLNKMIVWMMKTQGPFWPIFLKPRSMSKNLGLNF